MGMDTFRAGCGDIDLRMQTSVNVRTEGLGASHKEADFPSSRCRLSRRRKERRESKRSCREMWAAGREKRVSANSQQGEIGKTSKQRRAYEPAFPIWTDLTNTIRARGQQGPHQETGHTTVPDQTATDLVVKPELATWGRPHR